MEWTHILTLIFANLAIVIPLFIWNRAESREDIRHMDTKLQSNANLILAIHEEIKDFHGRLCALEEKNKK